MARGCVRLCVDHSHTRHRLTVSLWLAVLHQVSPFTAQGIFGVGQSTARFINKETNIKTKFM